MTWRRRVGSLPGVDAVDEVDVEFAHVHSELADAIDQGRVGLQLAVIWIDGTHGEPLGLLRQIQSGDRMLAHRFLILGR